MLESISKIKPELEKVIDHFKIELAAIRTGRATPALVENISVNCYGSHMLLKELSAISIPEPRQIVVTPWDKNVLSSIEKGIRESDLGINPITDGHMIRLVMPVMTEEYRKKIIKLIGTKAEEAKIAARRHREEAWKEIQTFEREGIISEDDKFSGKEELQKVIDEISKKIEDLANKKIEEINTI